MSCSIVGHPCRWARRDVTNSAGGFYNLTAGQASNGVGVDANGDHFYCAKRQVDNHDLVDLTGPEDEPDGIVETAIPVQTPASGAHRFPASGFCTQKGMCDQWQAAENDTGRDAPFRRKYHEPRLLKELWGATDARRDQVGVGVELYTARRMMHPSIQWHAGYARLVNSFGIHEKVFFNYGGACGYPYVHTDEDDNQSIVRLLGPFQQYNSTDPDAGGAGNITANVIGFTSTRDPAEMGAVFIQDEMERIGVGVERDTGELFGYSHAGSTVALEPQDLVLPSFSASLPDVVQTRTMGSFKHDDTAGECVLKVFPLRQELKSEVSLGPRVVKSVSDQGGGITRGTFKNVEHKHHEINDGPELGDSFDEIFSWKGGGGYPICPEQKQEIVDFYEPNKTTGSRMRGAWRGDTARTESGKTYVIKTVTPHGGASAGTWDGSTPEDYYCLGENYTTFGQLQDIVDFYDPDSELLALAEDDTLEFYKLAAVCMPGVIPEWTPRESDTWEPITGLTYNNNGEWRWPDTWLEGKTQFCFRLPGIELMDHRGMLPASTYEKTKQAIESLEWITTTMGSSGGGDFELNKSLEQFYLMNEDDEADGGALIETTTGAVGNFLTIASGPIGFTPPYPDAEAFSSVVYKSAGSSFGIPNALRRAVTILEAKAEVYSSGMERTSSYSIPAIYDCIDNEIRGFSGDSDTSLSSIGFMICGITGDDIVPIAEISGTPNQTQVVDITTALQAVVSAPLYPQGYTIIAVPLGLEADPESLLPGQPPIDSVPYCEGGVGETRVGFMQSQSTTIKWGGIGIGQISLRLQFLDDDVQLEGPRPPSMKALSE